MDNSERWRQQQKLSLDFIARYVPFTIQLCPQSILLEFVHVLFIASLSYCADSTKRRRHRKYGYSTGANWLLLLLLLLVRMLPGMINAIFESGFHTFTIPNEETVVESLLSEVNGSKGLINWTQMKSIIRKITWFYDNDSAIDEVASDSLNPSIHFLHDWYEHEQYNFSRYFFPHRFHLRNKNKSNGIFIVLEITMLAYIFFEQLFNEQCQKPMSTTLSFIIICIVIVIMAIQLNSRLDVRYI